MGTCDRSSGICICRPGFSGVACEKNLCPYGTAANKQVFPCSGHGVCLSLRDLSNKHRVTLNSSIPVYNDWDADKIYGCDCDTGWTGSNCSLLSCPLGNDPLTPGGNEVQLFDCICRTCSGGLTFSLNGKTTDFIPYDSTQELLAYRLQKIGIESVRVNITVGGGSLTPRLCSVSGSMTIIEFRLPQGPAQRILVTTVGSFTGDAIVRAFGESSWVVMSQVSASATNEFMECSNRGLCDRSTGVCRCFSGFSSSNGLGNIGNRGDCGYYVNSTVANGGLLQTCPRNTANLVCSGNGICNNNTFACSCSTGYGGPDCSQKTCYSSNTWFGSIVTTGNRAISRSPCSGVGDCDGASGTCTCGGSWLIFGGSTCQYLDCFITGSAYDPISGNSYPNYCSGNGACLSLRELAKFAYSPQLINTPFTYSTPWDSEYVKGCSCFRSTSVDLKFDPTYRFAETPLLIDGSLSVADVFNSGGKYDSTNFYRGPFSDSASDWFGFKCDQAACPTGDNPETVGANEIQSIRCRGTNGTFTLSFRGNQTLPIPATSTLRQLEGFMEQLYTVRSLSLTLVGNTSSETSSICSVLDQRVVYVEFQTEFGDLPILLANSSLLQDSFYGLGAFVFISEIQTGLTNVTVYLNKFVKSLRWNNCNFTKRVGTKENQECSGQGICDNNKGICHCSQGYFSSSSDISQPGNR